MIVMAVAVAVIVMAKDSQILQLMFVLFCVPSVGCGEALLSL